MSEMELNKEEQEKLHQMVQDAVAFVSQERVDKVIDMMEKIKTYAQNHPNNSQTFVQLLQDRGNFTDIPSSDEIRGNPKHYVPKLENDLMIIFDSLQRGAM
jgi:hypothetical protein